MARLILFAVAMALPAESLVGVRSLSVVAIDRQSNDVIPPRTFAQSVIAPLEKAGVRVVAWKEGEPELIVFVGRDRVDLELRQPVTLPSQPTRTLMASTWWTGGAMTPQDLTHSTVPSNLVHDFIVDWSAAQNGAVPKPRGQVRF